MGDLKLTSASGSVTLSPENVAGTTTITVPSSTATLLTTDGDGSSLTGYEGTAVASTGEAGGTKFLREDGDGTCSWQAGGADTSLSNLTATGENKVAQAWINLDGTGTIAIRDSYNVSSITDNGTGDYTITFDTAFANDDYCAVTGQSRYNNASFNDNTGIQITSQTTTIIRIVTWRPYDQGVTDHEIANVVIFGEQ